MKMFLGYLREVANRISFVAAPVYWLIAVTVIVVNFPLALAAGGWALPTAISALLIITVMLLLLLRRNRGIGVFVQTRGTMTVFPPAEVLQAVAARDDEYEEDLAITVWVGRDPSEDKVLEERFTRPHRAIEARALTLVSPYVGSEASTQPAVFEELKVDESKLSAHWQQSSVAGRGIVRFDTPASADSRRWRMLYRIPEGLWNPLRSIGVDVFRYDIRGFPVGRFTVRFVIDGSAQEVLVEERSRRGTMHDLGPDLDGNYRRLWVSDEPAARVKYDWELRVLWDQRQQLED